MHLDRRSYRSIVAKPSLAATETAFNVAAAPLSEQRTSRSRFACCPLGFSARRQHILVLIDRSPARSDGGGRVTFTLIFSQPGRRHLVVPSPGGTTSPTTVSMSGQTGENFHQLHRHKNAASLRSAMGWEAPAEQRPPAAGSHLHTRCHLSIIALHYSAQKASATMKSTIHA